MGTAGAADAGWAVLCGGMVAVTSLKWGAAFLGLCAVLCLCAAVITAGLALLVWSCGDLRFFTRAGALAVLLAVLGVTGGTVARRLWTDSE